MGFRSMRWVRLNRRPWAWLALLALTLQLGMAFGHVHGLLAVEPTLTATVDAGNAAGCKTAFIDYQYQERSPATEPTVRVASLRAAVDWIKRQG